ncbi:MAG: hypothetical protein K8H88_24585, partial [Sandaracinaceae bacterium]|nr:hypothetical protein [Sandaracinaceae bacterium]
DDLEIEERDRAQALLDSGATPEQTPEAESSGTSAIVGSDTWRWPFEGEYWADEFEEDPASGADDLDEAAEEAALDEEPAEGDAPSEGAPAPDPAAPSAESP